MEGLKKKIEEAARTYARKLFNLSGVDNYFITGALSPEAKEYWQHGMYTEEEVNILMRKCWNASDDFREEWDRINAGNSNFTIPHSPNFKKWFEQNKKTL